jgi:hypothetical protein
MPSFGMLRRVPVVRADVLKARISSIIMVTRVGVLRLLDTANVVHSLPTLVNLMMEAIFSTETSVLS